MTLLVIELLNLLVFQLVTQLDRSACESAALELLEFEPPTAIGTLDFLKKLSIFRYFATGLFLEAISLAKFQLFFWNNSCGFSE